MRRRSGWKVMLGLIGMVKPLTGYMLLAIFMGLIGHLCAAFITVFGGYAILEVLGFDVTLPRGWLFGAVLLFAVLRGVLRYAEQACNHFIAFKLLALIRDKVFQALRRLSPAKLEGKDKGNLISIITSDIELLEVFYAHTISPIAIAVLFSGIMCLFIGKVHWILGVIAFAAYFTVGVVMPLFISKISGDTGIRFRGKSGELSSFMLDSLRGLSEVLQYGQGNVRLAEMNKRTDELSADEQQMKKVTGQNMAITNTVILLFDLGMLFVAADIYQRGMIDFTGLLVAVLALMSSFGPVVALANLGSTLQNTFAAGNRVLDILEETPLVADVTGKKPIEFTGVSAMDVSFSYNEDNGEDNDEFKFEDYSEACSGNADREVILSDVSIRIPENSITGISGRSGSGKSTLLKLFMRFWEVKQGNIKISDTDISEINTDNLRNMESFVTQETQLFHDSIRNNLRIAKLTATDEEIVEACKKASIHDFIMSLPEGYDTKVGELGDTLSGGERQRIGLARAFLHDAPLMLLDEPTSNLDSLNEAIILKSLYEERKGKTIVLVSHRQSTMRITDTVYSVEHGRIS